jgi:two-component system response regulator DesR
MAGERIVDPALAAAALSDGESPLTAREGDALAAAARGATIGEIAARLAVAEGTVRRYLAEATQKLGARTPVEAARMAEQQGWL